MSALLARPSSDSACLHISPPVIPASLAASSSTADESSPPGLYDINATLAGARLGNYAATIHTGTLEVVKPASLSGIVFVDLNNDGQVDFGEPGVGGVTIRLRGTDDLGRTIDLTMTTDTDGTYQFGGLRRAPTRSPRPSRPATRRASTPSVRPAARCPATSSSSTWGRGPMA